MSQQSLNALLRGLDALLDKNGQCDICCHHGGPHTHKLIREVNMQEVSVMWPMVKADRRSPLILLHQIRQYEDVPIPCLLLCNPTVHQNEGNKGIFHKLYTQEQISMLLGQMSKVPTLVLK